MMDAPRQRQSGRVSARDLIREQDGARLECILDPLLARVPEVRLPRMTNAVTDQDVHMRPASTDIGFRCPTPERFEGMLRSAGFHRVSLHGPDSEAPVRGGDDSYVAIARTD
jgi:hypothetical protein